MLITKEFLYKKYVEEKCSLSDIACIFRVTEQAIYYWMKKYNIKARRATYWTERRRKLMSGKNHPMFGKTHNELTRKKMSIKVLANNAQRGKIGELSHMWRGGVDSINRAIRDSHNMVVWRNGCFMRDNYSYQICNVRGGRLHVDHIKPLSSIILEYNIKTIEDAYNCKELWNIDNGRTLCEYHHKQTPTYGSHQYKQLYSKTQQKI